MKQSCFKCNPRCCSRTNCKICDERKFCFGNQCQICSIVSEERKRQPKDSGRIIRQLYDFHPQIYNFGDENETPPPRIFEPEPDPIVQESILVNELSHHFTSRFIRNMILSYIDPSRPIISNNMLLDDKGYCSVYDHNPLYTNNWFQAIVIKVNAICQETGQSGILIHYIGFDHKCDFIITEKYLANRVLFYLFKTGNRYFGPSLPLFTP